MPRVAKAQSPSKDSSTANIGFEAKLWLAADKLRNNMDAAEYKQGAPLRYQPKISDKMNSSLQFDPTLSRRRSNPVASFFLFFLFQSTRDLLSVETLGTPAQRVTRFRWHASGQMSHLILENPAIGHRRAGHRACLRLEFLDRIHRIFF